MDNKLTAAAPATNTPLSAQPAVNPVVPTPPQDSDNNKMIWWLVGGLVIIILVIVGVYFFLSNQQKASLETVPVSTPKAEEDLESEINSLDVDSTLEADFTPVDQDLNAL